MLLNYLKIAWRNITGYKWSAAINIFGLAAGMAASIMLYVYISHERSFDRFHENGDKIYRVITHFSGAMESTLPRAFPFLGELAKEGSPQVTDYCRVKDESTIFKKDEEEFKRITTLMVDSVFPDFFSFPAKSGNLRAALADPRSVVISSELAERMFGDEDPLGKVIQVSKVSYDEEMGRWSNRFDPAQVGAILSPLPNNSLFQFDALMSFEAYDPQYAAGFSNDVFVFLMVEGKDPDFEPIIDIFKAHFADMDIRGIILNHEFQALTDIHFGPEYGYDIGTKGSMQLILIFAAVAAFIILIAVINFINLITARSEKRAIEASIRKVSGASRRDIAGQFLGESVLMSLVSFLVAMVLVELFLEPFAGLLYRDLSLSWSESISLFFRLLGFVVIIGLISGLYPAIMFSRFQPAEIMRGRIRGGNRNPMLRIILVVIQFAISVVLIISIAVFNRQVNHMKHSDLGFEAENVMIFSSLTTSLVSGYDAIKAELLQSPRVLNVSSSQAIPGYSGSGQLIRPVDMPAGQEISVSEYRIQKDFGEVFQLQLADGRWFDFDLASDRDHFMVNEAAAKAMGLTDPVGEEIVMWNRTGKIIGVVKDFHWHSLRQEISPLIFTAYQNAFYLITVRIDDVDREQTVDYIRNVFDRFDSNYPFSEWYATARFNTYYRQEENQNTIFNYASLLAVIIAMLGLLGLSSFIVMARRKEIGIRKVMGATVTQITLVLFRDFAKWVLLANLIAWPLAWYAMEQWLSNYPYRISMSIWYLLLAGTISLLVALFTVSGQTYKAAVANPAEALKKE
jgi:putative ABC transport system permease protein